MTANPVQSIERVFIIIEALAQQPAGMHLTELSERVALHKSTVHRLLASLQAMGYVAKEDEGNKYRLTLKLFELGSHVLADMDLHTVAQPYLDQLSRTADEAVHLVVLDGTHIIYIGKTDFSKNSVRMDSRIGLRGPTYCTATGKSILSTLPDEVVEDIWNRSKITKRTENTITSFQELKQELAHIRTVGYAVDNEENELGVRCVGAVVLDHTGAAAGAISVSAPLSRMDEGRIGQIAQLVIRCAGDISAGMGCKQAR